MPRERDPLEVAVRALRRRDLAAAAVDERLERAGLAEPERREALETLDRLGYVDDSRFAVRRAQTLAARGWGDAGIAADLERQGIDDEQQAAALATLEPERERALRIVEQRGPGTKTAGYLARHGFAEDAVELARFALDE